MYSEQDKGKEFPVYVPEFGKKWGKDQSEAWLDLKTELTSPTILVSPDRYAENLLIKDASGYGFGAVMLQKDVNDKWRTIAFASPKLKGAEVRYTVTEKEYLETVLALRKWRNYLHGGPKFDIVTDHIALRWLISLREPRGRLAWWMVEVKEFYYENSHVTGSSLVVPDCLSRDTFAEKSPGCPRCNGEIVNSVRELCSLSSVTMVL
jgi:RNase H-like domain found in reverse transcriptase